jgi:hypothetical protein
LETVILREFYIGKHPTREGLRISTFWTNTIWYVLLGIATVVELAVVLHRTENRGFTIAFFLTVLGTTLFVETTLLIYLKSYTYYPMILKNALNPYDDVLAGNLFSQFSISVTLLLATVLNLKRYWYLIFAVLYGLIEELFMHIGIYSHNWYRTWMTIVMLPCAFWAMKFMYVKILHGVKPCIYYGYIVLGLFPLNVITLIWLFMLTGIQDMSFHVLADPIMSRHFIVLILFFVLSASMMLLYFSRIKPHWKAAIVVTLYALYYISYKLNFIMIREGWFLPVSSVTICWMYFSTLLLDRLYGEPLKKT